MEDIKKKLTGKNEKAAYEFARQLGVESAQSDQYLEMIPVFAEMLEDQNSYVRTRAFLLICNQARWAANGQIDAVFNQMIPLLNDPKPTVVRQCLNALQELVLYRPEMTDRIAEAINEIDITRYKDSMSPLITKDIEALKRMIG